jgi:hypothetical protein
MKTLPLICARGSDLPGIRTFHYINVRTHNITKMNELKVIEDDNTCQIIYKKCHLKSYCNNDIKYHVILDTIYNVLSCGHFVHFFPFH